MFLPAKLLMLKLTIFGLTNNAAKAWLMLQYDVNLMCHRNRLRQFESISVGEPHERVRRDGGRVAAGRVERARVLG